VRRTPRVAIERNAVNDVVIVLEETVPSDAELRLMLQLLTARETAAQPPMRPRRPRRGARLPAGSLLR
jgi:hypothetical protein